jgi:CBS domain-containing protein
VIGVVDESDIFMKDKGMPFSAVKMPMLFKQWVEPEKLAEIYADAHLHTAADIMERDVFCVDVEEDVTQVAFLMAQHNLERVPVLENDRLVGIISRVDIIRFYALEGKRGKTE